MERFAVFSTRAAMLTIIIVRIYEIEHSGETANKRCGTYQEDNSAACPAIVKYLETINTNERTYKNHATSAIAAAAIMMYSMPSSLR